MLALKGLGAALRELRRQRGLTQAQAAAKVAKKEDGTGGIDQGEISRWEKEDLPNLQTERLSRYLDALGASLADLAKALEASQGEGGESEAPNRGGELFQAATAEYAKARDETLGEVVRRLEDRVAALERSSRDRPTP